LITKKKKNVLIYIKSFPIESLQSFQTFDIDDLGYIHIDIFEDIDLVMEFDDDVPKLNWLNILEQTLKLKRIEDTPNNRISVKKKKLFGLF